jgi:hypothetical protein
MKLCILFLFSLQAFSQALAFEPYYSEIDVKRSACYNEYVKKFSKDVDLELVKKLKNKDLNKRPLLNKREYNLALSAIEGTGNYTFDEIFCKVQEDFNQIERGEVLDWLRYGFISGDFCPLFPFISGYYNWESAYKYIVWAKEKFQHKVPVLKKK